MITKNKVVTIHYRLNTHDGDLIESSFEQEPMVYLHGSQNIIIGLEKELEGKAIGDTFKVDICASDAYGDYLDHLCQTVPKEAFGKYTDLKPGMRFTAETDVGPHPVQVVEVHDNEVVVDGNHPLAGQDLTFEIEVMAVRDATQTEISHGHVHDDDSCDPDTPHSVH